VEWKRLTADLEFLGTFPGRLPEAKLPEIGFVGRSNVGKSSAINALLNRKKAARVSGRPGRTQAVNLFRVSDKVCFADLPGYGFAKAPASARKAWAKLVHRYVFKREALALVVCLVDARHPAQKGDIEMVDLLSEAEVPYIVVATKIDRLKRSKHSAHLKALASGLRIGPSQIIPFSSMDKTGLDVVWEVLLDVVGEFQL
jgi:GTP-binding protein